MDNCQGKKKMERLEIISVRLSNPTDGKKIEMIFNEICSNHHKAADSESNLVLYKSPNLNTDWSVHLHGVAISSRSEKSKTGQVISEVFGEFGIVSHSVWEHV